MPKHLGYCHNCAQEVTTENLGVMIIAQKDFWCNRPQCKTAAQKWRKRFNNQILKKYVCIKEGTNQCPCELKDACPIGQEKLKNE